MSGARPVVRYFHQADDPYSWLAARALPHLEEAYGVRVMPFLVPPPDEAAAPDAARLRDWSMRDAHGLAQGLGLTPPPERALQDDQLAGAQAALTGLEGARAFAMMCGQIEAELRGGQGALTSGGNPGPALDRGARERARLGHYLGAMFHFEGEWYWGLDRLGYLEERLAAITGRPCTPFAPRLEVRLAPGPRRRRPVLEAFISLRSPYTYIAMARLVALAEAHGAQLRLRPVLPMVMRGLPVPLAKRLYIVRDTKREAERLGLPFGLIADPVGAPAERGLALTFHAMEQGKGAAFAHSFLKGVFAQGVDARTRSGLLSLCQRAGLSEADMDAALADESWRDQAEANREAMLALGIWGVPAFRVDERPAHWGQDRLWAVERDLIEAS